MFETSYIVRMFLACNNKTKSSPEYPMEFIGFKDISMIPYEMYKYHLLEHGKTRITFP